MTSAGPAASPGAPDRFLEIAKQRLIGKPGVIGVGWGKTLQGDGIVVIVEPNKPKTKAAVVEAMRGIGAPYLIEESHPFKALGRFTPPPAKKRCCGR